MDQGIEIQDKVIVENKFPVVIGKGPIPSNDPQEYPFRAIKIISELKESGFFPEGDRYIIPSSCPVPQDFPGAVFLPGPFSFLDKPDTRIQVYKGLRRAILYLTAKGIPLEGDDIAGFIAFFLGMNGHKAP
jgi:hypothetical protein